VGFKEIENVMGAPLHPFKLGVTTMFPVCKELVVTSAV
jgi:hypothetical protein